MPRGYGRNHSEAGTPTLGELRVFAFLVQNRIFHLRKSHATVSTSIWLTCLSFLRHHVGMLGLVPDKPSSGNCGSNKNNANNNTETCQGFRIDMFLHYHPTGSLISVLRRVSPGAGQMLDFSRESVSLGTMVLVLVCNG